MTISFHKSLTWLVAFTAFAQSALAAPADTMKAAKDTQLQQPNQHAPTTKESIQALMRQLEANPPNVDDEAAQLMKVIEEDRKKGNYDTASTNEALVGSLFMSHQRYADGEKHYDEAYALLRNSSLANIEAFLHIMLNYANMTDLSGDLDGAGRYFAMVSRYLNQTIAAHPESDKSWDGIRTEMAKLQYRHYLLKDQNAEAEAIRQKYPQFESEYTKWAGIIKQRKQAQSAPNSSSHPPSP